MIRDEEKRPAIFLDRDGVLTREKSYVCRVEDMDIFPYTEECIRAIHEKGYYAIVITNQSGVARGMFAEQELLEMNKRLMEETGVDAVYYCPHHPRGVRDGYAQYCTCRKPNIGLIERACVDYNIDLLQSYMVGDRATDILAGKKAGIRTILLESGYGTERLEQDVTPDYVREDLREVIALLL